MCTYLPKFQSILICNLDLCFYLNSINTSLYIVKSQRTTELNKVRISIWESRNFHKLNKNSINSMFKFPWKKSITILFIYKKIYYYLQRSYTGYKRSDHHEYISQFDQRMIQCSLAGCLLHNYDLLMLKPPHRSLKFCSHQSLIWLFFYKKAHQDVPPPSSSCCSWAWFATWGLFVSSWF